MIRNSLRGTIMAIAIAAIIVASTTTVVLSSIEYRELYRESAAEGLRAVAENLSSDLIPLLAGEPDPFDITNLLLRLDQYRHIRFAVILDREGTVLTQYVGNGISDEVKRETDVIAAALDALIAESSLLPEGVVSRDDRLIARRQIGDRALPLGYLLLSKDLSRELRESTGRLLSRFVPITGATLLVVIALLIPLLSRMFRPLGALQAFTNRVRESRDYSLQAQVSGTREISDLTSSFNSMLREIDEEVEKNRRQNELLKSQRSQMETLANFDALTGLSNRQFVMQTLRLALASAKREQRDFAILFMDLDGFKAVNDSFGHEVGDRLLERVGELLHGELRESDLVARLGGDEFLILLDHEPDTGAAARTADRLIAAVRQPQQIGRWRIQVSASIGIATAKEANYDLSDIMVHADVAMYQAKQQGKGQHTQFLASMATDEQRRLRIAAEIIPALENNEFTLHYQPKVRHDSSITGFDALIRWHSSALGSLMPDEFIPIAERSGHIQRISRWVIERSCQELPRLQEAVAEKVSVALNLSVHDLRNRQLPSEVDAIFKANDMAPDYFEFEITETAYLSNFDSANEILRELRELGCRVTLDDFGTGFSSLGYLTRLKIDSLKIDRQFVEHLEDSERDRLLARTIVEMATQLGMSTVAEGVETAQQAALLLDMGCDMLQGYLFARPMDLQHICNGGLDIPRLIARQDAGASSTTGHGEER